MSNASSMPVTGRFRKVPVVIEAERLTFQREIKTLEGVMIGKVGDWLITGVKGEQYPCKDVIFRMTYQPEDDAGAILFAAPAPPGSVE